MDICLKHEKKCCSEEKKPQPELVNIFMQLIYTKPGKDLQLFEFMQQIT